MFFDIGVKFRYIFKILIIIQQIVIRFIFWDLVRFFIFLFLTALFSTRSHPVFVGKRQNYTRKLKLDRIGNPSTLKPIFVVVCVRRRSFATSTWPCETKSITGTELNVGWLLIYLGRYVVSRKEDLRVERWSRHAHTGSAKPATSYRSQFPNMN